MNPRSDPSTEMIRDDSRVASEDVHENMRAAGDVTAQAGAEIILLNAKTVQQALQSAAEIAVRMTEYSVANINAIVEFNGNLVEVTQTMSRDWMRFAQEGIEHLVDFQEEVVCGSLDAFLGYAQRISNEFMRMADELTRTTATELTDGEEPRLAA